MKEVGKYTCAEPGVRIQKLLSFSQRLHGDQRTIEQWGNWGLTLGKDLLKLEGRVMPPEDVYFGGNAVEKTSDWTRALQSMKPIVSQGKLDNWFILHPKNSRCIKVKFILQYLLFFFEVEKKYKQKEETIFYFLSFKNHIFCLF